ncbi:MAG: hypothetical protein ACO1N4_10210 [Pedobacter sp.]
MYCYKTGVAASIYKFKIMSDIHILNNEILSDNWYTLRKITYELTRPDGSKQVQNREAYDRGNGVFEAYMSPGSVTEILYFFVAAYEKSMKVNEGGGLAHEEEHIKVLELAFEDALNMIDSGEIKDAKTIILIQHLRLKNIL